MLIFISQIENKITFEIKWIFYLELLTPETIKLLGSKDKNDENKDKNN